ncbi:MAG: iron dependent repressor, metal binding and dimerization domain protein [Chitinophagales bacterium]|nr:FeoA domain-containing protein [Bacteroidota bacterium]MCB9042568.1 FeoA domain-containing protein [Chitinophagales bacterium]
MQVIGSIIYTIHGELLFAGILLLVFVLWFFFPKKGGYALISTAMMNSQKVMVEDALKYLFDCAYKNVPCNLNSIAGNLQISSDKAGRLIEKLLKMNLVRVQNQEISLTDIGRSYALRIVRVHRIWERYFADETSIAQKDWHEEACKIEHLVSIEATEELAAKIGNPVFDPHGDPIPTSEGKLPKPKGILLNAMKGGDIGKIIHIEDEPQNIYEQLVVQGLYPGMQVYVTEILDNKIVLAADGDECMLTPLFAAQITVEKLSNEERKTTKNELLSELRLGETAEIAGISPNCRGLQRRRLMDLGIIPGSKITAVLQSASGDPVAYSVLGTTIGIRKQQSDLIFIKPKKEKNNEQYNK